MALKLCAAIFHRPHADETYAQWEALEDHLSKAQQIRLLEAWNTYLKSPEADEIVHMAFATVIRELGQPITRQMR